MLVYKILRADEWAALQEAGETPGAPVDVADGYVHLSTAEQAPGTAAKHFAGADGLMLLTLDTDEIQPLKWEVSRGGQEFPHLYGPLRMVDVLRVMPLPLGPEGHDFAGLL